MCSLSAMSTPPAQQSPYLVYCLYMIPWRDLVLVSAWLNAAFPSWSLQGLAPLHPPHSGPGLSLNSGASQTYIRAAPLFPPAAQPPSSGGLWSCPHCGLPGLPFEAASLAGPLVPFPSSSNFLLPQLPPPIPASPIGMFVCGWLRHFHSGEANMNYSLSPPSASTVRTEILHLCIYLFRPGRAACLILVPPPRIEPAPRPCSGSAEA